MSILPVLLGTIIIFHGKCSLKETFKAKPFSRYDTGCYYNFDDSNFTHSVCDCWHLTNFGIMFDYTGRANPDNKFLSMFTYVAFSLSIFCLLLTEALKFYMEHKKK